MRFIRLLIAAVIMSMTTLSHASDDVTFGVGMGALYSGIGLNIGWRSESDLRYIASGCAAIGYTSDTGWQTACGIGAGWVWANVLSNSNKHGIGLYVGPVGYKGSHDNIDGTMYGAGISYSYFFEGIKQNGWTIGTAIALGHNDDKNARLLIQAGYQY